MTPDHGLTVCQKLKQNLFQQHESWQRKNVTTQDLTAEQHGQAHSAATTKALIAT